MGGYVYPEGVRDEEVATSRAIDEKIRWCSSSSARRSVLVRSSLVLLQVL